MVRTRGQAHGAISRCKRSFAEARGPDAGAHGVWARRQGLWRLVLESEWDCCLSGKTNFEEDFTPSFDIRAQHINRGAGLAPKTSRNTKSCAGNPVPSSLSSVIVFIVLRRSPVEIVLHQHRHHAIVLPKLIYYFAPLAGSRRRGRHRAERVQNSEVPCFRYLDRSDREDVRLHQPR